MTEDDSKILIAMTWRACAKDDWISLGSIVAAVYAHVKKPDAERLQTELDLIIERSLLEYKLGLTFYPDGTVTRSVAA